MKQNVLPKGGIVSMMIICFFAMPKVGWKNAWRIAHGVRPSTDCILRDEGGSWDKKQRLSSGFELNVVPLQHINLLLIKHQKL